ncbi:hypothetical protein GGTG_08084 [Gaeumannomyces tritici R3-111a-1]|uniref:Nucleoside phosphorylase domain-containing protein n=1 Tax=Gaeumannomyces tritici (strain R3-111a-1) TaxID=644352 RepID=J3P3J8_GAET3|nr:hypothetical protein GGTG_08084 [Gaeumannomyces tritici R3-111a-1]EJT74241.1 hypothetical protein GGTG_08084 [Gaeumannomyces tritici R3-111a-1]
MASAATAVPLSNAAPSVPKSPPLDDFDIAVICALTIEANPVVALLKPKYDNSSLEIPSADYVTYKTGVLGGCNAVIAFLPEAGKSSSASVAESVRRTFPQIKLALVVGICGCIPFIDEDDEKIEVILGDVVISQGIVRYDYGKHTPDGFELKTLSRDALARPSRRLRSLMAMVQMLDSRDRLASKMDENLEVLRKGHPGLRASYPTASADVLYRPSYRHQKKGMSCSEAGCGLDGGSRPSEPRVHFGWTASADKVMSDGKERDRVAGSLKTVNFEMEGEGVAEKFPDCIVIKGVADYADSHKDDGWRRYAAATAAACASAFLTEFWSYCSILKGCRTLKALSPDLTIWPRFSINSCLTRRSGVRKLYVLNGMGGIGKTQLALNFAYEYRDELDAVFWVEGHDETSLKSGLAGCLKRIPQGHLPGSRQDNNRWLLVLDNVDKRWKDPSHSGSAENGAGSVPRTCDADPDMGAYNLQSYISADHGSIRITSRLNSIPGLSVGSPLQKADATLSRDIFNKWRFLGQYPPPLGAGDDEAVVEILKRLDGLPLALAAAGSGDCARFALCFVDPELVYLAARSHRTRNSSRWGDILPLSERVVPHAVRVASQLDSIPRDAWSHNIHPRYFQDELLPRVASLLVAFGRPGSAEAILGMGIGRSIDTKVIVDDFTPAHIISHEWLFRGLADAYISQKQNQPEAENILRRILRAHVSRSSSSWDYENISVAMPMLGDLYVEQRRYKYLGAGLSELGMIAIENGQFQRAKELFEVSPKFVFVQYGPDSRVTLEAIKTLAQLYRSDNLEEATSYAEHAHDGLIKLDGISRPPTVSSAVVLAAIYNDLSRSDDAIRLLDSALEAIDASSFESAEALRLYALYELARARAMQRCVSSAEDIICTALEGLSAPLEDPVFEEHCADFLQSIESQRD